MLSTMFFLEKDLWNVKIWSVKEHDSHLVAPYVSQYDHKSKNTFWAKPRARTVSMDYLFLAANEIKQRVEVGTLVGSHRRIECYVRKLHAT